MNNVWPAIVAITVTTLLLSLQCDDERRQISWRRAALKKTISEPELSLFCGSSGGLSLQVSTRDPSTPLGMSILETLASSKEEGLREARQASRILNRTRHPFKNPQQKKESELAVGCIMAQLGSWPLLAAFSYCFSVNFLVVCSCRA